MFEPQNIENHAYPIASFAIAPTPEEIRAELLRGHFTAREAKLYGIDKPYSNRDLEKPLARPVWGLAGAALASFALFTTVGFLATLGLADPSQAIATVPTAQA